MQLVIDYLIAVAAGAGLALAVIWVFVKIFER